jgi:hypothetical protein
MAHPPYRGQGKYLPPNLAEGEGEWIVERSLFLWFPSNPIFKRRRLHILPKHDGFSMIGFNVDIMAEMFSITASDLRSINRNKQLAISWIIGPIKGQPADVVTNYIITLPDGRRLLAPVRKASIAPSATSENETASTTTEC